jgi:hypothetical protein
MSILGTKRGRIFQVHLLMHQLHQIFPVYRVYYVSTDNIFTPWDRLAGAWTLWRRENLLLLPRIEPRSSSQTFEDRRCHVVSVTDPYGRILGVLDRSPYLSIKKLLSRTHEAEWTPFQTHYFFSFLFLPGSAGIEPGPPDL